VESRSAQWHAATTDCHESLLIGSTVIGGEGGDSHMDRQKNGDLTSLTFLFGERELKMFQAESEATFMVPTYIFHMPSSNGSLVIAMKPNLRTYFMMLPTTTTTSLTKRTYLSNVNTLH
jgi:hypothetical protein